MEQKVVYYDNELEDEFSDAVIQPKVIDGSYKYEEDIVRKLGRFFWYKVIARPLAFVFLKLKYRHKIIGRESLRRTRRDSGKKGFFLYGNHTHFLCDALIPTMVSFPVGAYVIVHPNNVSMPFLGRITPSLGALPLPDDGVAARNFMKAVKDRIEDGKSVTIYPEAHIWPYCTRIRAFTETTFRYPIQYNVPAFCFTNTYQRRRHSKTPRIVTYIDGPFYAEEGLKGTAAKRNLRDKIYSAMCERSKQNEVELVRYVPRGSKQ